MEEASLCRPWRRGDSQDQGAASPPPCAARLLPLVSSIQRSVETYLLTVHPWLVLTGLLLLLLLLELLLVCLLLLSKERGPVGRPGLRARRAAPKVHVGHFGASSWPSGRGWMSVVVEQRES